MDGRCAGAQRGHCPRTTSAGPVPPSQAVAICHTGSVATRFSKSERDEKNLDYKGQLHRLAVNDPTVAEAVAGQAGTEEVLDRKTLALVRIAALVAEHGPVASLGEQADAAWAAGATGNEIVGVLIGLVPIVGLPRVVDAAPKMALALGFDIDETL